MREGTPVRRRPSAAVRKYPSAIEWRLHYQYRMAAALPGRRPPVLGAAHGNTLSAFDATASLTLRLPSHFTGKLAGRQQSASSAAAPPMPTPQAAANHPQVGGSNRPRT